MLCTLRVLSAGESYSFLMISDTHFGSADSFSEKIRGSKRTRADKAMPLYRKLFKDMAAKKGLFLIHAGDVIEGYAKDDDAQKKEFEKSIALLKEYFTFPIYYVRGNHETSGGSFGYENALLPEISRNAKTELKTANYTVKQGKDIFIFVDCYSKGWLAFIDKTLKSLSTKPRYLFIVLHQDLLLPFRDKATQRMMKRLATYNTIILHGHTHCTVKLSQKIDGRIITAFSVGTQLSSRKAFPANAVTDFSKQLARINRQAGFDRYPRKKEFFEKESLPNVCGFQDFSNNGSVQGYVQIKVSDSGIHALIYGSDPKQKPLEVTLLETEKHSKGMKK